MGKKKYRESRETLQKRLEDYINDNFRLRSDKMYLENQKNNLEQDKVELQKANDIWKQMFKVNGLIMMLQGQMLNLCNCVDNCCGIKRAISNYQVTLLQELNNMPGSLNPAGFDPNGDDDDIIDLDDYDDQY